MLKSGSAKPSATTKGRLQSEFNLRSRPHSEDDERLSQEDYGEIQDSVEHLRIRLAGTPSHQRNLALACPVNAECLPR